MYVCKTFDLEQNLVMMIFRIGFASVIGWLGSGRDELCSNFND
jgi:hypothetical protein